MKTELPANLLATDAGREADAILRACVHCGFCLATCPTYLVEGNELDSPRGRIYLIKNMLEQDSASAITRNHLDRCLTCQACETTCPSGVDYHHLLALGRREVVRLAPRPLRQRLLRWTVVQGLSRRQLVSWGLWLARPLRWLAPSALRPYLKPVNCGPEVNTVTSPRQVILVQGCVQPGLAPATNAATRWLLGQLGISTITATGEQCCGALAAHLDAESRALSQARANIDAWWPHLQAGAEALVMTASGCSNQVREYVRLLADDPVYGPRAQTVDERLQDISEFLLGEDLTELQLADSAAISWHCPCTAQHGQSLDAPVRTLLERLGFSVSVPLDAHLCCGSAGSYSLLQPEMATELRRRKLQQLESSGPAAIVTANIGCQIHLGAATATPVVHWVELLAAHLQARMESHSVSGDSHV